MKKPDWFVLDCSVTMAWILLDDAMSEKANEILSMFSVRQAKVPTIWPLEVANVLCLSERTHKLSSVEVAEFTEFLSTLPISVDSATSQRAMGSIFAIAKAEQLSVYDAAYLEICIREDLPLATFDKALKKAAQRVGVRLL